MPDTGESQLHSPLCSHRPTANLVLKVLLAHGAKPNCAAAKDSRDMHGSVGICVRFRSSKKLLYGDFRIHPNYGGGTEANLRGAPHV